MVKALWFAALMIVASSTPTFADQADLGYGPINTSDPSVKGVCQETTLTLVGSRFENEPDTRENRTTHGVRIKTDSGLYLSMPAYKDEQTDYYAGLKVGQRVQTCLTRSDLSRRGGESNRFCVNSSYRIYDYDLERAFTFDFNGCHA
jgi:hypothetical protein